jgi:hypothetical protein
VAETKEDNVSGQVGPFATDTDVDAGKIKTAVFLPAAVSADKLKNLSGHLLCCQVGLDAAGGRRINVALGLWRGLV